MTIHYVQDLATARIGSLLRLLLRWKGGIWKSVYFDLILWSIGYTIIAVIYRTTLSPQQQRTFALVVQFCSGFDSYMPLVFMLGFFVETVMRRWWMSVKNMGITDDMALTVASYLPGVDETSIRYKRTIVRYMCLFQVLVYRTVSTAVREKYPDFESLVRSGIHNHIFTMKQLLFEFLKAAKFFHLFIHLLHASHRPNVDVEGTVKGAL
ncbi:unnamed protein product [Enterobius vermicularis]|uniref:Bestrophin homolog n=1 Tax=Enterobius vermicularis TaxID=51028 RepID=A0A0N4V1T9_ENTVE|nr:unnamed protein product [Enterobius vermicularis]